jgi:ubiquinol-cytochrome c reductase core subunit 2
MSIILWVEYEFHDDVLKLAQYDYDALQVNPTAVALDALHSAAFRRGLGNPLLALPTHPTHHHEVGEYAAQAYTKANLVLVASGATTDELKPQIEEFWKDLPAGKALTSPASKFVGGETRIPHADALQVYAIGFPGSALYGPNASPEHVILAHFLGGVAPIKWSHGQSPLSKLNGSITSPDASGQIFATNISYSDAGIFTLFTSGSVEYVTKAASGAVKLLQDVAKGSQAIKPEDVKRAIASARYATYAASEARLSGLEPIGQAILDTGNVVDLDTVVSSFDKVTPEKLKQVDPPQCI